MLNATENIKHEELVIDQGDPGKMSARSHQFSAWSPLMSLHWLQDESQCLHRGVQGLHDRPLTPR